jgi:hypothetical protein
MTARGPVCSRKGWSGVGFFGLRSGVSFGQQDLAAMAPEKVPLIFRLIGAVMFFAALLALGTALLIPWLILSFWR